MLLAGNETNIDSVVNEIVGKYKGLEHNETFKEQIKERYKHLLKTSENKKVDETIKKTSKIASPHLNTENIFFNAMNITSSFNKKASEKIEEFQKNREFYEKPVKTLFYFYSESMPSSAFERFYIALKSLQKKFPDELIGYVVFRGFPEDLKNMLARYDKEAISGGKFKFHPLMYNYYDLNSVPAYAIASCPKNFSFKQCKNHMLVKGDLSVAGALKIFSQEDATLSKFYYHLTDAKSE
jgi:hypothetical protein